MLDAFKKLTGGKNKQVQEQKTELESLIVTAREERVALSAMMTALAARSAKLTPIGRSLEQVNDNAASLTARLEEIKKEFEAFDERVRALTAAVHDSETRMDTLSARGAAPRPGAKSQGRPRSKDPGRPRTREGRRTRAQAPRTGAE